MACRCKKHEECEECPEWIFTLADLLMCMMGLFVILWVLKPGGSGGEGVEGADAAEADQQWVAVAAGIREAFGYVPNPASDDPIDVYMMLRQIERMNLDGPGMGGETRIRRQGAEGTDPEVTTIRPGDQAAVGGRLLFEVASAELSLTTREHLDQIARRIRGHRNIILVKGHTSDDDFPDTAAPEQEMELSIRRAKAVADYLTGLGVSPDVLRVQGCSTFEPVVPRAYTPQTQALNRRVEVEATSRLVREFQQ